MGSKIQERAAGRLAVHRMVKEVDKLKELFMVSGEPEVLAGGQGQAFRIGRLVFKPVENPVIYEKTMEVFSSIETKGYIINVPVKSINGRYCELDHGAVVFEEGNTSNGRLPDKLLISEIFHRDLSVLNIDVIPFEDHMWNHAIKVLFHDTKIPMGWTGIRKELCEKLLENLEEMNDASQIIHSDLGGNILFREDKTPVIIDLSPSVAPKKFADAIIVADAIAWGDQPMESIYLLRPFREYVPYLKAAVTFRVLSIALHKEFNSTREKYMLGEWEHYKPIWDAADSI